MGILNFIRNLFHRKPNIKNTLIGIGSLLEQVKAAGHDSYNVVGQSRNILARTFLRHLKGKISPNKYATIVKHLKSPNSLLDNISASFHYAKRVLGTPYSAGKQHAAEYLAGKAPEFEKYIENYAKRINAKSRITKGDILDPAAYINYLTTHPSRVTSYKTGLYTAVGVPAITTAGLMYANRDKFRRKRR